MRLVKSIINNKRSIIGFMVEGTEKEFGGLTQKKVIRPLSIQQMAVIKFHNNQVSVDNTGRIIEDKNFKISDLDMCVFTGTEYVDIPNKIELIGRFLIGNDPVGFKVRFGDGLENDITYDNVVKLTNWFKPSNFMVRKSASGKYFISGKKGFTLDELPSTVIAGESKAKRTKSHSTEKDTTGKLLNNIDILDIFEFIKDCHGAVINLPGEKYTSTQVSSVETGSAFKPLGIGEVASPYPEYSASKLNVNALFKKVGVVNVSLGIGEAVPITSFTYTRKCIFHGGENYIKNLGVAVPGNMAEKFIKSLGKSLAITEITDTKITQPLGSVIESESGIRFFSINTDRIDAISKAKMKSSILSTKELFETVTTLTKLKLVNKVFSARGGVVKGLKNELSEAAINSVYDRKLFGVFRMMSAEALEECKKNGLDVYTGAYVETQASTKDKTADKKSESTDKVANVSIEYSVDNLKVDKFKAEDIVKMAADGTLKDLGISPELVTDFIAIKRDKGTEAALKYCNEASKKLDNEIGKLNEKLWRHNISMYTAGNGKVLDDKAWTFEPNNRLKNTTQYRSNEYPLIAKISGCEM